MSATIGFIAIEGNQLSRLAEIFSRFQLIDTNKDLHLNSWAEASKIIEQEYLEPNDFSQRRVVWFQNNWTIIEDHSLLLCTDTEALQKNALEGRLCIYSFLSQSTSNSHGFWHFTPTVSRTFFIEDGETIENTGTPLPQEANLNINEDLYYDDIIELAATLGIDYYAAEQLKQFTVKQLINNAELNAQIEQIKNEQKSIQVAKKPWWKFW